MRELKGRRLQNGLRYLSIRAARRLRLHEIVFRATRRTATGTSFALAAPISCGGSQHLFTTALAAPRTIAEPIPCVSVTQEDEAPASLIGTSQPPGACPSTVERRAACGRAPVRKSHRFWCFPYG